MRKISEAEPSKTMADVSQSDLAVLRDEVSMGEANIYSMMRGVEMGEVYVHEREMIGGYG